MKRICVLLFAFLIFGLLVSGCRNGEAEETGTAHTGSKGTEEIVTPSPVPPATPTPRDDRIEMSIWLEGMEETVTAVLESGDFSETGGPAFSLYIEEGRYEHREIDGVYYFGAQGEMGKNVYLEISFKADTDSETLAPAFLEGYGNISSLEDEGIVSFGEEYSARLVCGTTSEYYLSAYLLDVRGGVVAVVLSVTPEAAEGHGMRLAAYAQTLSII